ncbi:T9SS type A sorting domain-containing protein [Hymenobacter sp. BRD128]|uniref:T9SS type A sorting domain-containing protein n=1 Tax=Hymenobacter sp. BRD128 TaxID=2675878 RepID=UPI001566CACF|nr:T9SS type A sorting domain-containing protein [Hymenobacter sp. BRD128]QKG58226.1 T9SS type A sorting domain-containing protein [Hymenobacter sp. BRD128]
MGQTLYTFNGGGTTGNWNSASSWTTDPTGSTAINQRVPANGDNIVVTNSFVLQLSGTVTATSLSITVQRGGVLDLSTYTFSNSLTSLAGQGTLRIGTPYFPAVTTNNFAAANTGTVEFYNWPAGPTAIPIPTSGYNNLRLLNTTATAYEVQLDNDLTLNGSLTLIRTNTTVTAPLVSFNLGLTPNTNRTLNVLGDITIGAGTSLGVTTVAGSHTLNASGSLTNNGTINLHNGTADDTQVALLNFTGATNANFACNGSTDLDILQVDKGTDSQVLLNITSTVNVSGTAQGNLRLNDLTDGVDLLVLVNGVAKLGNNIYLQKISNKTTVGSGTGFSIGSTSTNPTLWIAGATVINDNDNAFIIYGTYHISAGKLSSMTPDAMVVRETGQVIIDGGTTSVNKFRPSSTSASHRGSFTMTGGTFESLGTVPFTLNDNFARFAVPYISQAFRMSGGTLRVQNPASTDGSFQNGLFHIGVNPNNVTVTGGTIEVLLPNSSVNGNILTTSPLWNLTIKKLVAGGTSKAVLAAVTVPPSYTSGATTAAQPITVLNNFTLDATNPTTFDAAGLNVTIQGTLTVNSGCTYLTGANTTTFSGGQDQLLANNGTISNSTAATLPTSGVGATGTGSFNNWTINKSAGTLTLGGTVTTYYTPAGSTLSLLSGVLNDGGKTINVQGNLINSASHSSGGGSGSIIMNGATAQTINGDGTGVFGNLKIFNTGLAAGAVAVTLQANIAVANILTIQSNHIFAIGANRLSLTNVSTGAIQPANGFTYQRMIQTAGNQSDLGLQKTYGGADNFTFPVGTGTKFTPATIYLQVATALAKYGQVSVSPVNSRSPFVASTTNSLAYYWKVRSVGFGAIPSGAIQETFQMIDADAAGTIANYIAGRYLPTAWNTSYSGGVTDYGTYSSILFNALGQFDGEFTAGLPATFGPITSFYSRTTGNWETPATWSTTGYNGAAATTVPGAGNPVFIGSAANSAYHTVNVTANTAKSGSLVIDRGSTLDVGTTTGHNFGALPDAKVGGSGRLRVSSSAATAVFPGGDFGSFIQYGGGTVEYYTTGTRNFTVPTVSGSLTLNQYRNLWLNAASGQTITLPAQDLRIYAQLKTGVANGATTFPGTVFVSSGTAGNLRADSLLAVQAGVFRLQGTTARSLTVDTDVLVASGATFDVLNNAAVTHSLSVSGKLTNNGTLDFKVGTGLVNLTFLNNQNLNLTTQNANLTSAGPLTDLYTLTVNKGLDRTSQLTLDGSGLLTTPSNGWLTLTTGTLNYTKPSATLTIHDAVATPYLITDNAGLTVNAAGGTVTVATNNNAAADLKLAGQLQILQGTLQVGANGNVGNDLEYASAGAPGIKITGGNLYVNGQIRRTVANLDGALRFDQSGGTIDIDGQGAAVSPNNERGLFEVQGKGSIFRMSGGSLNLHRSNQKSPILTADLYLAPDSTVVTAGTVVLGNTAAGVGNVTISVSSTVPLYDLQVAPGADNTNTNTGLLTGVIPLTLSGSLTIGNNYSFFNANGLGLNINQNLFNNNSSTSTALNAGGFQPITTTQTTTFVGGVPTQLLNGTGANLTVFGSLVLNTPQTNGTLQLGGNILTAGTLTLTKGTLDDKGYTITALGDVLNSATHLSSAPTGGGLTLGGMANQNIGGNGTGVFGNVTLNNGAGATTISNQQITKVLTFSNGVLTIGSNLLWLSNPAAGAVTGYNATHFIRTNGIVADLGLRKSYPNGALDFTFPLGSAAKYTPVRMNVTANSKAGTLTVQPIDLAHPSTTGSGTNKISFYWKVSSTIGSPTVSQYFTYGANDVAGNETLYKVGRFYNGAWTPLGGIASVPAASATTHTLTNPSFTDAVNNTIDGDYTGGDATEFQTVPTFYSRNSTAGRPGGSPWTSAASWTNNSDGSDPLPTFNTYPTLANPVIISSGHLITTTTGSLGAANLLLNGTLDLGTYAANNFNTVKGTGTVRIGSALFPAGNYAAFVAANGGTVDYSGAVQLPARDTYNNLTFSGGNGKQLSNLDLTINGALTLASGTTVDNPTSQNITLTSATSGATLGGTFNLNDGTLTTGAFLTNSGTLTLGAGLTSVGTNFTNSGTLNNGTGGVSVGAAFSNSGAYKANLGTGSLTVGTTFANSGTYTAGTGKLTVGSDFTNTTSGTFTAASSNGTAGNSYIMVNGNFSNGGTYNAAPNILRIAGDFTNSSSGTFSADASTTSLYGNFTNTGTFNPGTSLVQFITDANRVLTGSTVFYDVQKVSTAALTLQPSTTITVADVLTMRGGLITTGTTSMVALANTTIQPIVGASPTTYINGRLQIALPDAAASIRVFPVGLGGRYRPVTITPQAASSSAVVLVEIINGAPAGKIDATLSNLSANRYYRIQLQSGTITQPAIQLSYNTDVVDEEVHVPGNLRVAKSTGPITASSTWSTAGGAGVFSPDYPRGYTTSAGAQTAITTNSFFALASTNQVDNPLTGTAPLPVELVSFTAARQGTTVRTAWTTASEKNSAYFVVQRSADGHTFADVIRVAALGNSLSRHDYTALDASPLAGVSYYRLRQVDQNGTSAYSPVVTVRFDEQPAAPALVVYPNPTAGQQFQLLTTNLAATGGTVQLLDNVGRLVLTKAAAPGTVEMTIQPAQPLASGIYIATWQTADGLKLTTKVVVN